MFPECICLTFLMAVAVSAGNQSGSRTPETVAFSVGKASGQVMHGSSVLTFDREYVNLGDAFDLLTSTFTCPLAGLYVFHLHGLSGSTHKRFLAGIYLNNDLMVSAYAKVREFWSMGSNTVLLNLRLGDTVKVKFMYGGNDVYGDNDEQYTTFSGYRIAGESSHTEK